MVQESIGVVLKSISYSESSIISRIYTPEFGKISVIAKGAKKPKGGKSAMLEPMNLIEFQMNFKDSKDIQTLREISILHNLSSIRNTIQKMAVGLVMVEILDKTTHNLDPSKILYRLIEKSLRSLDQSKINNILLFNFFLIQFSKYSGFNPIPNHCHNCNNILKNAFYNNQSGFLDCFNCRSIDSLEIDVDIFLYLMLLSTTHIDQLDSIQFEEDKVKLIEKYLFQFMEFHLLGMRNIKSLKFFKEVAFS